MGIYIYGDHMFTVDDPSARRSIIKESCTTPKCQEKEILANIGRRVNFTPASQYLETYTN